MIQRSLLNQENISLNEYKYLCFTKSYKIKLNIASLTPTEATARQHSFRAYHQVQRWYGNEKNACYDAPDPPPPAAESLLKLISCKLKKGCQKACGCRKAGIKWSVICANCTGSCNNSPIPSYNYDEDADEISVLDVSIDDQDEVVAPGPSETQSEGDCAKFQNKIYHKWIRPIGKTTIKNTPLTLPLGGMEISFFRKRLLKYTL